MHSQDGHSSRTLRLVKSKWSWGTVLLVLIGIYVTFRIIAAINSIEYALSPPELPEYQQLETQYVNPAGWPKEGSNWFHHASQGTATIPVPYQWLVALEEPRSNPWWIFFGEKGPYVGEYILRLGFVRQDATELNPDALPIGIAKTNSIYFPGIDRKATAAGFTCAACHTGQMIYDDKRYVVDGGPATIDLGLFTKSLGAALGQTILASKFSILNGRFERFAQKVLGGNCNVLTKAKLKEELSKTIAELANTSDTIDVTEGFSRLDALNRIGNQVFQSDMQRSANYAPIDAPVNFPHIWTTSWFNWVQYDASIMQPLIRNSGEALGVKAFVDTKGPDDQRFATSVDIKQLHKIENWIGGTHPKENNNKFNGLSSPKWPAEFPAIDSSLVAKGAGLYKQLCQGCHLPPVDSEQFWSDEYWRKIQYVKDNEGKETEKSYLKLKVIPVSEIGTDTAQAGVLGNRTVDTTGLNLNSQVCTWAVGGDDSYGNNGALTYVPLNDSATSTFGLALGAFVERTNQQWFDQNYIPPAERPSYEGMRPNCLQIDKGYKARPLNGVWATAPFLHNGSIATIYDLLSVLADRPTFVQLGNQAFDAKHVGVVQNSSVESLNKEKASNSYKLTPDYSDGLFILDTRQPGNYNTGHIFDDITADNIPQGRIGRKLSEEEKLAIIEYLKTL